MLRIVASWAVLTLGCAAIITLDLLSDARTEEDKAEPTIRFTIEVPPARVTTIADLLKEHGIELQRPPAPRIASVRSFLDDVDATLTRSRELAGSVPLRIEKLVVDPTTARVTVVSAERGPSLHFRGLLKGASSRGARPRRNHWGKSETREDGRFAVTVGFDWTTPHDGVIRQTPSEYAGTKSAAGQLAASAAGDAQLRLKADLATWEELSSGEDQWVRWLWRCECGRTGTENLIAFLFNVENQSASTTVSNLTATFDTRAETPIDRRIKTLAIGITFTSAPKTNPGK